MMKWQERFLQEDEEECQCWNEISAHRGDASRIPIRQVFLTDGRFDLFMSLSSPQDIDFATFPELDFTSMAKKRLEKERDTIAQLNAILSDIGQPTIPSLEEDLEKRGELEEYLRNPLFNQ